MNPTEARSHRLTELSNLVKFLDNKGTTSEEIIKFLIHFVNLLIISST